MGQSDAWWVVATMKNHQPFRNFSIKRSPDKSMYTPNLSVDTDGTVPVTVLGSQPLKTFFWIRVFSASNPLHYFTDSVLMAHEARSRAIISPPHCAKLLKQSQPLVAKLNQPRLKFYSVLLLASNE